MLELKNISFEVTEGDKKLKIIQDLSLTVENKKFIVITGPNGSGKSTLAKIIAGIEQPSGGKIFLDGEDITEKNITERAKLGISFAFQQPVKFKGLEVFEVGLCARDYINREVNSSLSGGELKRIEIATIIARQTKFSIFDEPEAGIDLWSFQNLIKIFESLRKNIQNSSIVIISHQERILSIADEIIVLDGGKVTKRGTSAEILPEIIGTAAAVKACNKLDK